MTVGQLQSKVPEVAELPGLPGLLAAAAARPDAGIRYAGHPQSYPALLEEAGRLLGGLQARGVRSGERVVLVLGQPSDMITALWACFLGGLAPCPLVLPGADAARWERRLAHVDRILDRPLLVTDPAVAAELPGRIAVTLADLAGAGPGRPALVDPDDVALLMLTSGSTGRAKAVMHSHRTLLAALAAKAERLGATADDVTLNWISFDHIAAIEMHLLPLSVGATQVQVDPAAVLADPLEFLRLAAAHRVTLTFTPNFLLGQLNGALDGASEFAADLSSIRHIISGGEAVVVSTGREFLRRLAPHGLSGRVLVPAFGMTETCAGSVFSTDFPAVDDGREFAGLGRPVRGLELRVVGPDDRPLPAGELGELQLRGPMVCTGYRNDEAATRAAFAAGGWFRTGDRGRLDGGRLLLAGRSKDSIIVNGVNYFSDDLEAVLDQLDGVERSWVAVFPTRPPGTDTEQLAVAFTPSVPLDDEAALYRVLVAVRSSVVLHWGFRPAVLLPLPRQQLPKSSLGKISRSALRQRLESGGFADVRDRIAALTVRQLGGFAAPVGDVEARLAGIYALLFDIEPGTVSATASFFDLGGTSLDILRLKRLVEDEFGVADLPVVEILRAPTVRALARWLRTRSTAGYDPLVTLQPTGSKTPLFCVHPGVGEVLVFVNLARYFVNDRPFHALRARGFGAGESPFGSFAEMVDSYVAAIRRVQPSGPYAIAGYSYGGAVAFEIAKVLEASGERVDFVGIVNLPPHIRTRMDELDFAAGAVNLAFFLALVGKVEAAALPAVLRRLPDRDAQLAYLMSVASAARLAELDLDRAKLGAWVDLAQAMVGLGRTYEPAGTVRSVTVFCAIPLRGSKADWLNDQLRRWDDHAREPNRYVDVAGEHYTLMGPTHVGSFQAVLRRELDRALGDC